MTAVQRIGAAQRRARLGRRQSRAGSAVAVADALVALHATDPASVFLSTFARCPGAEVGDVERALYTDRGLVRMLGMRRTVWVVPRAVAAVVHAACGRDVAAVQRRRLVQHLTESAVAPDPGAWLRDVERDVTAALVARGEATATELVADVPALATRLAVPPETAGPNATSRVLLLLGADGQLVRGRPCGGWTSTRYRWSPVATWWPGGLPELDPDAARVDLARRWLATFGPAPASDLQWWAGWTAGRTRTALATLGAVPVDLDGTPGVALPEDVEDVAAPEPWIALLPALDPTPMGWQRRHWFLGAYRGALFDRTGNIGPTVWSDGRIVGGWAQRAGGSIAVRLFEDVGATAGGRIRDEAERLAARIGPVRVVPRFRTPLERELAAD